MYGLGSTEPFSSWCRAGRYWHSVWHLVRLRLMVDMADFASRLTRPSSKPPVVTLIAAAHGRRPAFAECPRAILNPGPDPLAARMVAMQAP